jgi:hypothetical protein
MTREILIDGLNLAYWCGAPPSLRLPVTLLTRLLADGHRARLYFDASARYRLKDEAELYERLKQHSQHFVEVPSGRTADREMLRRATTSGACIVTRDRYRDHRRRHRKLIDEPGRLLPGNIDNDRLSVAPLVFDLPCPSPAQAVSAYLEQSALHGQPAHGIA